MHSTTSEGRKAAAAEDDHDDAPAAAADGHRYWAPYTLSHSQEKTKSRGSSSQAMSVCVCLDEGGTSGGRVIATPLSVTRVSA